MVSFVLSVMWTISYFLSQPNFNRQGGRWEDGYVNSTQASGCFIRRSETPPAAPAWPSGRLALGWPGLLWDLESPPSPLAGSTKHYGIRTVITSPSEVRPQVQCLRSYHFFSLT
ncbi:hypothetical protein B0J18DRAFT_429016 [Chaetomium sp. MPI-SDFR-AT-0129]|nr:hypothetical protein B0J18DRAFT_429016 [Chaetomium sp. MPI-SDFR-AT-0129]